MQADSKTILAKLLATENITVQTKPGIQTAMFDLRNRVLMMPLWSEEVSADLQDLLLGHETGHALDTPVDEYKETVERIAKNVFGDDVSPALENTVRGFLNVVEDARIDKRQKRRYPGLRKNYLNGYKELFDRNFFGTNGRDINSMNFIDRANLFFKGGNVYLDIEFTNEERRLIKKMGQMETFEDAASVTEEVYLYCKQQYENQQIFSDDLTETDEDFDEVEYEYGEGYDDEESKTNGLIQGEGDIQSEQTYEKSNNRKGASGQTNKLPVSVTDRAWEEKKTSLVKDENTNYIYVNLPDINMDKAVHDYKRVLSDWKESLQYNYNNGYYLCQTDIDAARKELTAWRMKEKDSISFMVKEFEQRKAAESYIRQQIAKTGVIDTNKLHTYKFNDDIFRHITTIPKGKNHGFVMILDWSGSMTSDLRDTIKQLLSLCLFCKQIGVPFDVYAFKSCADNPFSAYGKTDVLKPGNVVLRNFLSSRMKTEEFNFASSVLWAISGGRCISTDGMGGTPLIEAILIAPEIVKAFQRRHKLEIVNTIFLTDGDGNGINAPSNPSSQSYHSYCNTKWFYTDKETGKTYELHFSDWGRYITPTLLKILKDKTQTNLVGFFLCDGSFQFVRNRFGLYSTDAAKFWRDNKFYPVKSEGYDEYYVISQEGIKKQDNELVITDKTKTVKQLAKVFSAYTNKKTVNRVLLRQFIERIAGNKKKIV